jgi:hypothetical protein
MPRNCPWTAPSRVTIVWRGPRRPRAIFSADTTDPCASRTAGVDVDRTLQIATVDVTVGKQTYGIPLQSRDAKQKLGMNLRSNSVPQATRR